MTENRKDVEFKTIDGLTLRGWLFSGPKGGPAVIVNGAVRLPSIHTHFYETLETNETNVFISTTNVLISSIARKRSLQLKLRIGLDGMA